MTIAMFLRLAHLLLTHWENSEEENSMRRMIFAIMMLTIIAASAACNTVRGVGRDVERAGEKTQDAAENVRRRM